MRTKRKSICFLRISIKKNKTHVYFLFQQFTEDINEKLMKACEVGNLQEVKRLLAAGGDVNAKRGHTLLTISAQEGLLDVVRFLLENGASIDKGSTWVSFKICK